ncbi:MAG: hypothetical protein AB8F34_09085 [Akkermansiaceae bacterium]
MFWCTLFAQTDEEASDVSMIPARPAGHVLDQARWFTPEEREQARNELSQRLSENDIDIYLVTLDKLPPQGAESFTRALGESWSRSPIWCIVFQVPGDPAGFHVEAGGVDMDLKQIDQTLKEAVRRARRENTEKERVVAAWRECSEGLRFIYGARMRTNERRVDATKNYFADLEKKRIRKRIYIAAGVTGFLLSVAMLWFIIHRTKSRRAVFTFPETSWRTRFQGPHSGGSGIVVNYRRKKLK